jgi:hypothetical protein
VPAKASVAPHRQDGRLVLVLDQENVMLVSGLGSGADQERGHKRGFRPLVDCQRFGDGAAAEP